MKPDLNIVINRRNTGSLKWDSVPTGAQRDDLIPLWVADMDFSAPACVTNALTERVKHGVYGYANDWAGFEQAVVSWMDRRHGWRIDVDHVVPVPGVMAAIALLIEELTDEGAGVIIQPPVYPPFKRLPGQLERQVIENPLENIDGQFKMDLDGLSEACASGASLALLCSPHNPVGRVWDTDELAEAISICARANIPVVVDEIHCDILPWEERFTPALSAVSDTRNIVSLVAPTKTFNLAGLSIGAAVIEDRDIRRRYRERLYTLSLNLPNILASVAAAEAYTNGDQWLDEVLRYIRGNAEYVEKRCAEEIPMVRYYRPNGTYLAWIDFSSFSQDDEVIKHTLLNDAGVWLNHGPYFGTGGAGYQRLNLACPRSILEEGIDRLVRVFGGT